MTKMVKVPARVLELVEPGYMAPDYEPSHVRLERHLRRLVDELRCNDPCPSLYRAADLAPSLLYAQAITMRRIADRLEAMLGGDAT